MRMTSTGFGRMLLLCALLPLSAEAEVRTRLSTEAGLEGRAFFQSPADLRQRDADLALSLYGEYSAEWGRRAHALVLAPFARLDSADSRRSHVDLRELYYRHSGRHHELRVGVQTVYWGATESLQLVNILNQTDVLADPDGETKLGQPMLSAAWIGALGTTTAYLMPYFRERRFPGEHGRLRLPQPVDVARPIFESSGENHRLDWALRHAGTIGGLDYGLAWFSGTERSPRFALEFDGPPTPETARLRPVYDLVDRLSLDLQWVQGGWLWKLEALYADSRADRYAAAVAGGEYTLVGVFSSQWDVGLLAEYLWDERGKRALVNLEAPGNPPGVSAFDNDLFLATRIVPNDMAGTEILAGLVLDLDNQSRFWSLEAGRRLGADWRLDLVLRVFSGASDLDPIGVFQRDDYASLSVKRYF
jgi:hypothetical protein